MSSNIAESLWELAGTLENRQDSTQAVAEVRRRLCAMAEEFARNGGPRRPKGLTARILFDTTELEQATERLRDAAERLERACERANGTQPEDEPRSARPTVVDGAPPTGPLPSTLRDMERAVEAVSGVERCRATLSADGRKVTLIVTGGDLFVDEMARAIDEARPPGMEVEWRRDHEGLDTSLGRLDLRFADGRGSVWLGDEDLAEGDETFCRAYYNGASFMAARHGWCRYLRSLPDPEDVGQWADGAKAWEWEQLREWARDGRNPASALLDGLGLTYEWAIAAMVHDATHRDPPTMWRDQYGNEAQALSTNLIVYASDPHGCIGRKTVFPRGVAERLLGATVTVPDGHEWRPVESLTLKDRPEPDRDDERRDPPPGYFTVQWCGSWLWAPLTSLRHPSGMDAVPEAKTREAAVQACWAHRDESRRDERPPRPRKPEGYTFTQSGDQVRIEMGAAGSYWLKADEQEIRADSCVLDRQDEQDRAAWVYAKWLLSGGE